MIDVYIPISNSAAYSCIQYYMIKKYIPDAKIHYAYGPFTNNQKKDLIYGRGLYVVPVDNPDVTPIIVPHSISDERCSCRRKYVYQHIIEDYIYKSTNPYSLIMDGDAIPTSPVDIEKILGGNRVAGRLSPRSGCLHTRWFAFNNQDVSKIDIELGANYIRFDTPVTTWKSYLSKESEILSPYFNDTLGVEFCSPSFLHFHDMSLIHVHPNANVLPKFTSLDKYVKEQHGYVYDKSQEVAIEKVNHIVNIPQDMSLSAMIGRYNKERKQWAKQGKPLRDPEEIAKIYDDICTPCEFLQNGNECGLCGCGIKRQGKMFNKLAWATTECPHKPPKWTAAKGFEVKKTKPCKGGFKKKNKKRRE